MRVDIEDLINNLHETNPPDNTQIHTSPQKHHEKDMNTYIKTLKKTLKKTLNHSANGVIEQVKVDTSMYARILFIHIFPK